MKPAIIVLSVAVLIILGIPTRAQVPAAAAPATSPYVEAQGERQRAAAELAKLQHERLTWPEDRERFTRAARTAWSYLDSRYHPSTGLVVGGYPYATMWDVGSMIAALYCAHRLNLLDDDGYERRMRAMLGTLHRVRLYDSRAFNKAYDARTGVPSRPLGWSTTDLGRLLIWLRVVGTDPRFQADTEAIVRRIDFNSMINAGYLWGHSEYGDGRRETYQEGTVGYEQYSAQGYALWGHRAEKALRWQENALPVLVMGEPVVADYRRWDRLTPEPFLLWGLEVGWDPATATLVRHLLLAQEERYRKTGLVTVTGEDAIDHPPHYFYYYCIYANGLDFTIDAQDRRATGEGPRWISSKAAYAFDALMPSRYTALAVDAVDAAQSAAGWASGVFEETGKSTGNQSVNTAAVILTAALYQALGEPILVEAASRPPAQWRTP